MADSSDNLLDRAEAMARRLLEKIGARADSPISHRDQTLSPRRVGEITSQIERAIEASLRQDPKGVRRVAPNSFDVLLTYEEASQLNTRYIEALAVELKTAVFEYINNRRYETEGAVSVSVRSDLFAKTSVIKATFDTESENAKKGAARSPATAREIAIREDGGFEHSIKLEPGREPLYIGRGAGVALRIDNASVSRLHCSVSLAASGEIILSDLGSANGTRVNGKSIGEGERVEIRSGDIIEVGDVKLIVAEAS